MNAFEPMSASTVSVTVAATTGNVLVQNFSGCNQVRVMNDGTATVWVEFGGSGVTAVLATSVPIGAGKDAIFSIPSAASTVYMAAIAAAATGKVYATPGVGGY